MAIKGELENALRDWLKVKQETDRARLRLAAAQASLDELEKHLQTADQRVIDAAGPFPANGGEKFFRVGEAIFRVSRHPSCDEIALIEPEG